MKSYLVEVSSSGLNKSPVENVEIKVTLTDCVVSNSDLQAFRRDLYDLINAQSTYDDLAQKAISRTAVLAKHFGSITVSVMINGIGIVREINEPNKTFVVSRALHYQGRLIDAICEITLYNSALSGSQLARLRNTLDYEFAEEVKKRNGFAGLDLKAKALTLAEEATDLAWKRARELGQCDKVELTVAFAPRLPNTLSLTEALASMARVQIDYSMG
jgi:hypothetical protein